MADQDKSLEQKIIGDNIRDLRCFHCESPNIYWHFSYQRFECVDCGSYIDFKGNNQCHIVKGYYLKGCVKILGMIHG